MRQRRMGTTDVESAIVGSGNPDRARSNARAADLALPDDALKMIEENLIPLTAEFAARRSG